MIPIMCVVPIITPFEIFNMIVCRVFIFMVDLWKVVWIRNKRLCNKTVDNAKFPFFTVEKHYSQVSFFIVRKMYSFIETVFFLSSYISPIADLVLPIIASHIFPFFVHKQIKLFHNKSPSDLPFVVKVWKDTKDLSFRERPYPQSKYDIKRRIL